MKVYETELTYAFLDINPLSLGHVLIVPKFHAQYLHEIPDNSLSDLLPVVKKLAISLGGAPYNILQNNGRLAHQAVDHVHFHLIPKTEDTGLVMDWEMLKLEKGKMAEIQAKIVANL